MMLLVVGGVESEIEPLKCRISVADGKTFICILVRNFYSKLNLEKSMALVSLQ